MDHANSFSSLLQYNRVTNNILNTQFRAASAAAGAALPAPGGGGKTVGRWLKDRREKKKEETRAHNAQLHAAVSVAGVAAAVAAIAAATAASSGSGKDEQMAKTDMAVASAATLVAAQCVEVAEAMGAEREHLASVVGSAVNVRSAGDIMTLTAAAATGNKPIIWSWKITKFKNSVSDRLKCTFSPSKIQIVYFLVRLKQHIV